MVFATVTSWAYIQDVLKTSADHIYQHYTYLNVYVDQSFPFDLKLSEILKGHRQPPEKGGRVSRIGQDSVFRMGDPISRMRDPAS